MDIGFEKVECEHLAVFRSKDGGWQLSKKLGFHKGSPARDYLVLWVEENGKWTLYITGYDNFGGFSEPRSGIEKPRSSIDVTDLRSVKSTEDELTYKLTESIVTVDTLFDVFDYICKNKYLHY